MKQDTRCWCTTGNAQRALSWLRLMAYNALGFLRHRYLRSDSSRAMPWDDVRRLLQRALTDARTRRGSDSNHLTSPADGPRARTDAFQAAPMRVPRWAPEGLARLRRANPSARCPNPQAYRSLADFGSGLMSLHGDRVLNRERRSREPYEFSLDRAPNL
jgi:hypothetical protein